MRALVQRVSRASVAARGKKIGAIGKGIVILVGVREDDTEEDARWLADKCVNLRIFENDEGKFDLSLLDIRGEALAVSQFTLYGDCRKGRRPSFTDAARPEVARKLYEAFVKALKRTGLKVETGVFAARMKVEILNDGPVTLMVETEEN